VIPLNELSASLLPQSPDQAIEPLAQLLERMAVRLGPDQVRVGCLQEDHRPEMMQRWRAWPGPSPKPTRTPGCPQPSWLLDPPLRLGQSRHDQPQYQGPLQLIAGPQRIEGGWWQAADGDGLESCHVQRDYFLFRSARAGLLWVFQQRLSAAEQGWYLHGVFA
jgi:protein ImuB